jgi:hypothetical protein
MSRILRVFPRRTNATPTDELAVIGYPGLFRQEADEVHVSCTFTWDKPLAEYLANAWSAHYPNVKLGGPAYGDCGGEFTPGLYLKPGYVITSRGCNNHCWFCVAWKREGRIRELPITEGWNVLDNNLLQCSEQHIRSVFEMLKRQPRRAEFTGGLEAARLQQWHIDLLVDLNPKQIFFAYDTPEDYEPLRVASRKLFKAGVTETSHAVRCYVLIGYGGDTIQDAEYRLESVKSLGVTPMAMLFRDNNEDHEWRILQRQYARPSIIHSIKTP